MLDYSVNVVDSVAIIVGLITSFLMSYRRFLYIEFQLAQIVVDQSKIAKALERLSKVEVDMADKSARLELLETKLFNGGYKYERSS